MCNIVGRFHSRLALYFHCWSGFVFFFVYVRDSFYGFYDCLILGVSVGMGMPDMQEIYLAGQGLQSKGPRAISAFFMPRNLVNMASGHISIETGFQVGLANMHYYVSH